jgi:hypothetical protein
MITENQLRALDFEFHNDLDMYSFEDIDVSFDELGVKIFLNDFQLFGINDHRDLSKFIKLVYGS